MAIIDFPNYARIQRCNFKRVDGVVSGSIGGGVKINLTKMTPSFLTVDIKTSSFKHFSIERNQWRAFKNKLRGGLNYFSTYDIERYKPVEYGSALNPEAVQTGWDGTCSIINISVAGVIKLGGLPANFKLSAGDSIGFEQDGRFDIYDILDDAIANSGAALTAEIDVVVAPFVRTGFFDTSALVRIWKPRATFIIDRDSFDDGAGGLLSSVTFSGTQAI